MFIFVRLQYIATNRTGLEDKQLLMKYMNNVVFNKLAQWCMTLQWKKACPRDMSHLLRYTYSDLTASLTVSRLLQIQVSDALLLLRHHNLGTQERSTSTLSNWVCPTDNNEQPQLTNTWYNAFWDSSWMLQKLSVTHEKIFIACRHLWWKEQSAQGNQ